MKKIIFLFLTVSLFVFLSFLENVKAATTTINENQIEIYNFRTMTDEEILEKFPNFTRLVELRNYAKQKIASNPSKYDDYFIAPYDYKVMNYDKWSLFLYKNSDLYFQNLSLFFNSSSTNILYAIIFNVTSGSSMDSYSYTSNSIVSDNSLNIWEKMRIGPYGNYVERYGSYTTFGTYSSSDIPTEKYVMHYDSSLPVVLKDTVRSQNVSIPTSRTLEIETSSGKILTFEPEDTVIDEKGNLFGLTPQQPIVFNLNKHLNNNSEVESYDITIHFSDWNNSTYYYQYAIDNTSYWMNIGQQDYTFNIDYNTTIYARIMNREDDSYLTSATISIIDIVEHVPKINITNTNTVLNNNIIAMTLNINFDIWNLNKFIYQYSINSAKNEDFIEIKKNNFQLKIEQDCDIFVRILNRRTGEYITSQTFSARGIHKFEYDGKTYRNFIQIPISELYDYERHVWKKKQLVFLADSSIPILEGTKPTIQFYFQLKEKEASSIPHELPLYIYINNVTDLEEYQDKIANSPTTDPDGYGGGFSLDGGNFGGGGGGGRFDLNDSEIGKSCISLPYQYDLKVPNYYTYAVLTIIPNYCMDISTMTPEEFSTDSLYIFYNGKVYENVLDAVDDVLQVEEDNILSPFINLINRKFPIINQLWTIIQSLKYDKTKFTRPSLTIDFSVVGGQKQEFFTDGFFEAYNSYRSILDFFLYLGIGFLTIPKAIGYIKDYFGGGNNG